MKQLKEGEAEFIKTLEIQDILLISSEHTLHHLFDESLELSIGFSKVGEINLIVDNDFIVFEVEAAVEIHKKDEEESEDDNLLLSSKAKFAAVYSYEPFLQEKFGDSFEDFAMNFFQYGAITHILAYAREYFYSLLGRSGYPRLTLPLVKSLLDKDAEDAASNALKIES